MRELGVISWDGIVLGPVPQSAARLDEPKDDPLRDRRAHYQTLLGRPVSDEELFRLP